MTGIRTVIADDEAAARSRIRKLLREEQDVTLAAEAASGPETLDAVRRYDPDLLFLDIQMPGMDGFGVLEALLDDSSRLPVVVFVTAYDEYALRAFEARAIDYVLKPFDDERFREALNHARQRLRERRSDRIRRQVEALVEEARIGGAPEGDAEASPPARARPGADGPSSIPVRRRGRILLVAADDVDWIEAAGDYVRLHAGGETFLVRNSMNEMAERLGERFLRIHRSTIVRMDAVKELSPRTHGDYEVVLRDGTRLRLSRSYREAAAKALDIEL